MCVDTGHVADAAGVSEAKLRKAVLRLTTRGSCAQTAAAAATAIDGASTPRCWALAHPACPPWAIRALDPTLSPNIRSAAAGAAGWANRPLRLNAARRRIINAVTCNNPNIRRRAVACAPTALLRHLSDDPTLKVREVLAAQTTSKELAAKLAFDPHPKIRRAAASNPATAPELLHRLSLDPDWEVRRGAASNSAMAAGVLHRLSLDPDWQVRRGAALNLAAPTEMLYRLAVDGHYLVVRGVAANPSTPKLLLRQLAKNPDRAVRDAVAANPSTDAHTLERLFRSRDGHVEGKIAANVASPPALLEAVVNETNWWDEVAANPSASPELLQRLASAVMPDIRRSVARNPSTPVSVLEQLLAADISWATRDFIRLRLYQIARESLD